MADPLDRCVISRIVARRAEWEPEARVIATGGYASRIGPRCRTVEVVVVVTLESAGGKDK